MKKWIAILAAAALGAGCLAGCGKEQVKPDSPASSGSAESKDADGTLQITATIFPAYDWMREIVGDNPGDAKMTLLLDDGVDLHSYQPSAEDILKIASSDLFIYVGGESDAWVADALREASNPDMVVINLMDILGENAKEEELKEGMQESREEEEEAGEGPEYDEHVWMSLHNAETFCEAIRDGLVSLDPANQAVYEANTENYLKNLTALDERYTGTVAAASVQTLVFADRFPFRYLTDDYGIDYFAAFDGCSAETEASFETILFLAGKVDELGLNYVMTAEDSDQKIAQTVVGNTLTGDQQILVLDSMQSVAAEDMQEGVTYLSIMEKNLAVLAEALESVSA